MFCITFGRGSILGEVTDEDREDFAVWELTELEIEEIENDHYIEPIEQFKI